MKNALGELIRIAGEPTRTDKPNLLILRDRFGSHVERELERLLLSKNGFYAFQGALHIFSDHGTQEEPGLVEWSSERLWRNEYVGFATDAAYFAEDIFGTQFCLRNGSVATFDPETAAFDVVAQDIESWAALILGDYKFWTGCEVGHKWQQRNGHLRRGARLCPVTPFVLGGEYSVENIRGVDCIKGMKFRASIATQIRDLPEGAAVKLSVVD